MTKSTKTTKVSAVFLAAVLIAGTISLISPSFMGGAQAEPYGMEKRYGYDNSYDKPKYPSYKPDYSKDKDKGSVDIKKIKCNNINVNLNDISVDIGIPRNVLGSAAAESADEELSANALGNGPSHGGNNGFKKIDKDGFVFVCINNNNNGGRDGEDGNGPFPPPANCDECFNERSEGGTVPNGLRDNIAQYLRENAIDLGTDPVDSAGPFTGTDDQVLAALCTTLQARADADNTATEEQIRTFLNAALPGQSNPDAINDIIECLEGFGLVIPSA